MFYLKGCWKKFVKYSIFKLQLLTHRRSQAHIAINIGSAFRYKIGSLQVSIHVVQNQHIGKQKPHWDKKNKGNHHLKLCTPFVGPAPVRLLRPNMPVLYHVNGTVAPNVNFRKISVREADLRSRIFGTFVVKFLVCLPLLGFSNI